MTKFPCLSQPGSQPTVMYSTDSIKKMWSKEISNSL